MNLFKWHITDGFRKNLYSMILASFMLSFLCATISFKALAQEKAGLNDITAIVNIVRFIRGIKSADGIVKVGILYTESGEFNVADAERVKGYINEASKDNTRIKIIPVAISLQNLNAAKDIGVLYIPPSVYSFSFPISEYSRANKVFNIGIEKSCIEMSLCIVTVETGSNVEVFVSYDSLLEQGFDVDAAFKYMATKVEL
jgi:hypothetical protein